METKINEIDKKLTKLIDKSKKSEETNKELNNNTILMNKQIEKMSKELEQLRKSIESKDNDIKEIKKMNDFLLAENKCLKSELSQIRSSTEDLIFQQHTNEIDVVGIINCDSNEVAEKIVSAGKKWNLNLDRKDIVNVKQLTMKNKNEKFFRIKFIDQRTKEDFQSEAKKSKSKELDLNLRGKNRRVYFNDVLPFYTNKIFYYARQLKRDQNWKYVWSKGGKIYIRKDEKSPAILLKCLEDIETIKI